ncbi:AAA family ATPase [Curvibacter sp. CHRR-16]|uniref:BTAD domain-containing putative transcriptional regulator n=1 Tax=Curvibacter sp. CHRR-16 TaxID=2835872 RepID=UPI001BD9EDC4|nr:BTAD domain-containing putative transcriptional regulator [Curvibacter sp. CHRR-16]MBT0570924.1 AAA family ATPase [Curvibacter sp. CHRR-16]
MPVLPASTEHPTPPSRHGLHVGVLGRLVVHYDGQALPDFGYDKARALLAYLVVESGEHGHSRDKLASLFWPDSSSAIARGNLRRTLHQVRSVLADTRHEWLPSDRQHLGFDHRSPYHLDLEQFLAPLPPCPADSPYTADVVEQLEQRLCLYRGPVLDGLHLPDTPDFEHWLESQRQHCHRQRQQLLATLAQLHEQLGQIERAHALLLQEIEHDPWAEDTQRRLMRLLARQQRTSAALAQFEQYRAQLLRELDLEPEPQTLALVQAIRRGELSTPPATPVRRPAPMQRRQVCVLACELQTDEPHDELAADWLAEQHSLCMDTMSEHGGQGYALRAGWVMAYFGHPQAQEKAPIKALEAALALCQRLGQQAGLRLHIGAHSGWMLHDPRVQLPDTTGIITRHASELALHSPWGRVAVSPELQRQVEGYFRFEPAAETTSPKSSPHYQLLQSRSPARDRLQARSQLSPLVGRQREMRLLQALWERSRQGLRQCLHIGAEPGMGKSRLIHELAQRIMQAGGHCVVLHCQAELQHTPYHPFADWHHPQQDLLLAKANALAHHRPLLLVLEDIHWADQATLDWIQAWLQQRGTPHLLLLSSRSVQAPWPGIKTLALPPLQPRQVEQLIRHTAGRQSVPAQQHKAIVQRSDGVPLYVEEMVRSLQLGSPPSGLGTGTLASNSVPNNIWHLLAMRLESVGSALPVAQQAAAIGREVSPPLLSALHAALHGLGHDAAQASVQQALQQLEQTQLMERLEHPSGHYRFRHVLLQDAANHTLPVPLRRNLHSALVQLYQGPFQAMVQDQPERLAHHLAQAGQALAAAQCWLQAGQWAVQRSSYADAIFHYQAALQQLPAASKPHAPETDTTSLELALQTALGTALACTQGYGSPAAHACFVRAQQLSRLHQDELASFPMLWGLWLGSSSNPANGAPLEYAQRLLQLAQTANDAELLIHAHYACGNSLYRLGHYDQALHHLQQSMARGQERPCTQYPERLRQYGEDSALSAQCFVAWILWLQGHAEPALQQAQQAVEQARALKHAHTLCFTLACHAVLLRMQHDAETTQSVAQELLHWGNEHQLALWQVAGTALAGWASVYLGDPAGLPYIEAGLAGCRVAMPGIETIFQGILVDALWQLQRWSDCATQAQQAIACCQAQADHHLEPEFLRLLALCHLRMGHSATGPVADWLAQAAQLARQQGAQAWLERLDLA